MRTFPIFLDLEGSRVVVVGGGEQAAQKVRLLLKTPARIDVIHETLCDELSELAKCGRIGWRRVFVPGALDGCRLVYAAADAGDQCAGRACGERAQYSDQCCRRSRAVYVSDAGHCRSRAGGCRHRHGGHGARARASDQGASGKLAAAAARATCRACRRIAQARQWAASNRRALAAAILGAFFHRPNTRVDAGRQRSRRACRGGSFA